MNILQNLQFSETKPAILSIQKSEKLNLLAVGLLQNQWLKKHKTVFPTQLIVLSGKIEFHIEGEVIPLEKFDAYTIPVNVMHEVKGLEAANVFTLTMEKG